MTSEIRSASPNATPAAEPLRVSVVCPFYDEERILERALRTLLARLAGLGESWELVVVNDGSRDASAEIAAAIAREEPRLRVLGYPRNRGRGHALRSGIARARGDIVVTTEIDLSWGEDIVERLVVAMRARPDADLVIASPNLPGGGYRNVPSRRVLLSRIGNRIVRAFMTGAITMNTGMTRAYRREVIQSLPLEEDDKEFHLEVVLKARALGYRIAEIPAVLEWKDDGKQKGRSGRKSSTRVPRIALTHGLFSLFANPIRYVWALSTLAALFSAGFLVFGVVRFALGLVSVYSLIISLAFAILSLVLFVFGVLARQAAQIQTNLWRIRADLARARSEGGGEQR